jgi:hypothetical protein
LSDLLEVNKMVRKVADEALVPNYEETDTTSSYVSDGASISVPDLGANLDAPPAYGDEYNVLQLSQAGFEAGAVVTGKLLALTLPLQRVTNTTQVMAVSTSTSTRRTAG